MKPITLTVPPPIIMASDPILTNVHHYKWIKDHKHVPPLLININDIVTFRGRGGAAPYVRLVHCIRRHQGIAHNHQINCMSINCDW
jgi:hypothetical protein